MAKDSEGKLLSPQKKNEEEIIKKTKSMEKETGSEKLADKGAREQVPPFPPAKKGVATSNGSLTEESLKTEEESDFEAFDIKEFCQDLVVMVGDVARIFVPKLTRIDDTQKKLIGKPMSKVIVKHKLDKLCKDEFLFIGAVVYVGYKKITELKKLEEGEQK